MKYTDANVPIECAACAESHWEDGLENMTMHILAAHPEYTDQEAKAYATIWCQDAYVIAADFERDYNEQRQIDKSIDRDIDFQKHRV